MNAPVQEDDIRALLRDAVADVDAPPTLERRAHRAYRRRQTRHRVAAAGATAAVVAVAVGVGVATTMQRDTKAGTVVATSPKTPPTVAPTPNPHRTTHPTHPKPASAIDVHNVFAVTFYDHDHGYGLTQSSTRRNAGTLLSELVSTNDGGATWSPVAGASPLDDSLTNMMFVDAQHGITWSSADGGVVGITATKDGGAHWTAKTAGIVSSVTAADGRFFVYQSDGCVNGGATTCTSSLLIGTDGGQTWHAPAQTWKDTIATRDYNQVVAADQQHVFMLRNEKDPQHAPTLWSSPDAGVTWNTSDVRCPANSAASVSALDAAHLWVACTTTCPRRSQCCRRPTEATRGRCRHRQPSRVTTHRSSRRRRRCKCCLSR